MKNYIIVLIALITLTACSSSDKDPANEAPAQENKIVIETGDIEIDGDNLSVPIKGRCIKGYSNVVLQIGDFYKAFECKNGGFNFTHTFPKAALKENRSKKKDYVLRIRSFHEEKKAETLAQSLVVISYKDFQAKLVINQNLTTLVGKEGHFSDLSLFGQCAQNSVIEVEIFDDWRGVSMEEEKLNCTETGFVYFSRRPGAMKKGMRLLLREMRNEKPLASYEVVLFN